MNKNLSGERLRRLNKFTYIMDIIIKEAQLAVLKPHLDAYMSNPDNHAHLLEVYEKIEKVVKE